MVAGRRGGLELVNVGVETAKETKWRSETLKPNLKLVEKIVMLIRLSKVITLAFWNTRKINYTTKAHC